MGGGGRTTFPKKVEMPSFAEEAFTDQVRSSEMEGYGALMESDQCMIF